MPRHAKLRVPRRGPRDLTLPALTEAQGGKDARSLLKARSKITANSKTHATWVVFCATYAETGNIRRSSEAAGVDYRQYYQWVKRHPDFVEMFSDAQQAAADMLEDEAVRRAREGVRRPVMYRGKQIELYNPVSRKKEPLWEIEYSDVLIMFLLRGFRPQKYAPKANQDPSAGMPQIKELDGASMKDI